MRICLAPRWRNVDRNTDVVGTFQRRLKARRDAMYEWIKALHVIAVSPMAGMLYLPRLFVYHCDAEPGSKQPKPSR